MIPAVARFMFGCAPASPHEIAAGASPPAPTAKAAGKHAPLAPAADLYPHALLGTVSHGPRWTVRVRKAGEPIMIEGDGVAIALGVEHATALHALLGQVLVERAMLTAQKRLVAEAMAIGARYRAGRPG